MNKYKSYIVKWTIPDSSNDDGCKLIEAKVSGVDRDHALSKLMSNSLYQLYLHAAFPKELDNFTFNHRFLMWFEV